MEWAFGPGEANLFGATTWTPTNGAFTVTGTLNITGGPTIRGERLLRRRQRHRGPIGGTRIVTLAAGVDVHNTGHVA